MSELIELRAEWAKRLLSTSQRLLREMPQAATPDGDKVALTLESVGGLLLLQQFAPVDAGYSPEQLEHLVENARNTIGSREYEAWWNGLRIKRILRRYRQQVVAQRDDVVLQLESNLAAPSPAVALLETRQALSQQRRALMAIGGFDRTEDKPRTIQKDYPMTRAIPLIFSRLIFDKRIQSLLA